MEFPIPEMTSLDDKTKAALEKLLGPDKKRLIVFYCGFTKCARTAPAMWAVKPNLRTSTVTLPASRAGTRRGIRSRKSNRAS